MINSLGTIVAASATSTPRGTFPMSSKQYSVTGWPCRIKDPRQARSTAPSLPPIHRVLHRRKFGLVRFTAHHRARNPVCREMLQPPLLSDADHYFFHGLGQRLFEP